jgi:hypothetical protein
MGDVTRRSDFAALTMAALHIEMLRRTGRQCTGFGRCSTVERHSPYENLSAVPEPRRLD